MSLMTLPDVLPAPSSSAPKEYKHFIDSFGPKSDHSICHRSCPRLSRSLKPPKRTKKKEQVALSRRRTGPMAPSQEDPPLPSRPLVFERRKNPDLSAGTESQIREFQALAQSLLGLREQEHQEISRELHDNIAQVLSAATARLSLAREESIPAWLRQELLDLGEQLQHALADVRHLARDLRPSFLDPRGFAAALDKHAETFRERTSIDLDVRIDHDAAGFLEADGLTHLFRLAQEALHNVEDHSGARRAWVRLWRSNGTMLLEIGDDGCAFTPERVVEAQQDGHLGLLGMRERAELLGGQFLLDAAPGRGTVVTVRIPSVPPASPAKPPDSSL